MYFVACRNGFVKDFNGRLIYSADVRKAKPFVSYDEAYSFVKETALTNHYYAILNSDGICNTEFLYEAWDSNERRLFELITDDREEADKWISAAKEYDDCVLITQAYEQDDMLIERQVWMR